MNPTMNPTQNTRVSQMIQVQQNALELFKKKNADYGDAFSKFGVIGVLMRIEDKIQRSVSISKNGITLVDDEKIRDTLIDLHNYAAMAIMLLDENTTTISTPSTIQHTIQPILKS
jgi:hypothetical protein